jgi:hypothetical protein
MRREKTFASSNARDVVLVVVLLRASSFLPSPAPRRAIFESQTATMIAKLLLMAT